MPQTVAQRVAAYRARKALSGLARLEVHVHPDDREAVLALVRKLAAQRAPKKPTPRSK